MEFEIGDADYNVVGSLENNVGSVEKDQSKEVLISMDEEAVKKSIVFTIKIKVTKDMKEGNNQENVQEDTIDPDERDMEQSYEEARRTKDK